MKSLLGRAGPLLGTVLFLWCSYGAGQKAPSGGGPEDWSFHFQATTVSQGHSPFDSPYVGENSFLPEAEFKSSISSTLYLGRRLWKGGQFYVDPEMTGGSGLSGTKGIAGFPNGEIFRVSSTSPQVQIARAFYQQILGFGGATEKIAGGKNQLAGEEDISRLRFIFGKISINDFFDNNQYSHDPRTQFLNWALMENGAWDYAADTRGYTWGAFLELNQPRWALRLTSVLEPSQANGAAFDMDIADAHAENAEVEYRYDVLNRAGAVRVLYYDNHAYMGLYSLALQEKPSSPDIVSTRSYRTKYGYGINLEQKLTDDLGLFVRWGWNDGLTETWSFTEIDSTLTLGASLKGTPWHRPDDVAGLAFVDNGLSDEHRDYLAAGGYGFVIGDGALNYGREMILEAYYLFNIVPGFDISADYQFVDHPAYNQDRGPVSVFAGRLHYEM